MLRFLSVFSFDRFDTLLFYSVAWILKVVHRIKKAVKKAAPACRKTSRWSVFLQADAVFGGRAAKNKNRS